MIPKSRITEVFFIWVENTQNKETVKELNNALKGNNYNEKIWEDITGYILEELWGMYGKDKV